MLYMRCAVFAALVYVSGAYVANAPSGAIKLEADENRDEHTVSELSLPQHEEFGASKVPASPSPDAELAATSETTATVSEKGRRHWHRPHRHQRHGHIPHSHNPHRHNPHSHNPTPPPPPSLTDAELQKARNMALLAWGAYYPGNIGREGAENYYPCYGNDTVTPGDDDYTGYTGEWGHADRANDCGNNVDNWVFKGNIRKNTGILPDFEWKTGGKFQSEAQADIYFKSAADSEYEKDECLVAIAGTDDNGDIFISDINPRFVRIHDGGEGSADMMDGYQIARGDRQYYKAIREFVTSKCAGRRTTVTGHSLGAAATEIMHAYGDAVEAWAFAPPKQFKQFGTGRVFNGRGFTNPKCTRSGNTKLSKSYSFYSMDTSADGKKINGFYNMDPVPAAWSTRGMHCSEKHIRLLKTDEGSYTQTGVKDTKPEMPKLFTSAHGIASMHPMFQSYLPYLDALTDKESDEFHKEA